MLILIRDKYSENQVLADHTEIYKHLKLWDRVSDFMGHVAAIQLGRAIEESDFDWIEEYADQLGVIIHFVPDIHKVDLTKDYGMSQYETQFALNMDMSEFERDLSDTAIARLNALFI